MVYDFDAGRLELPHDSRVVVETDRGEAIGWTVGKPELREPHHAEGEIRRILRIADQSDRTKDIKHRGNESEALRFCARRARDLGLPMKLIAVEWAHSADKATFFFSSEERVDFRQLVRELAQRLRMRVEMRQVGPRDEAKIIGAMGPCGRETCCSSWMRAFTPTSIKMAKDQGLALNPQKVTGVCGRLLCCLAFEQETYMQLRKGLPRWGKTVVTPQGVGRVVDVMTLRRRVRVSVNGEWLEFGADEVKPAGPQNGPDRDDDEQGAEPQGLDETRPRQPHGERPRDDRRDERPRNDRPQGDRPRDERPRNDRPQGERPRNDRPQNERPRDERPRNDRSQGERPRSDRPQGERPQGERPQGERPQGERPQGERPQGERPRNDQRPPRSQQNHPRPDAPAQQPRQNAPQRPPRPPQAAPQPPPEQQGESERPETDEVDVPGAAEAGEPARRRRRRRRGRGGGGGGGGEGGALPNGTPPAAAE